MYPTQELNRLAIRKVALRRSITLHRLQCTKAAAEVVRPLQWLDRLMSTWRQFSPLTKLAAVPLGYLVKRTISSRLKLLGSLFRWIPIVYGAADAIRRKTSANLG